MPVWPFPSLSILPTFSLTHSGYAAKVRTMTSRSLPFQKGAFLPAQYQAAFQAAGRILFQGDSSILFRFGSALWSMAQHCAVVSGGSKESSEPHRDLVTFLPLDITSGLWIHFPSKGPLLISPSSSISMYGEASSAWLESRHGTTGAIGIAELGAKVTHESHCPVHLAMWLHFTGVTMLEILNKSPCGSIQPSYLHFNLKGTEIKMA